MSFAINVSVEAYDKIFHHYNFTIETEHRSTDVLTSQLYFAEVKQLSGVKSYFCCPLDQDDEGICSNFLKNLSK